MLLELHHITHTYGAEPVVRDLSFSLTQGQIGCLLGPSGCGKSTVLRCIAGFEPVTAGEIRLNESTVSRAGFRFATITTFLLMKLNLQHIRLKPLKTHGTNFPLGQVILPI